jgi:hypothetical protein
VICYRDRPDVVLEGRRKIGIEITNFYLNEGNLSESEQVQGQRREKAVSDAQQLYLASSEKKIELSFSFDKNYPIRDQRTLARKIAELGSRIEKFPPGEINKREFKDIPELEYVYLSGNYENPRWWVGQGHHGRLMSRDKLLAIVKDKERKSKEYHYCEAYWLLVVVDNINPAQDQEIRIDGFEPIPSTVFEKVLVYNTGYGHVLEACG